jgi:hypothetical protein
MGVARGAGCTRIANAPGDLLGASTRSRWMVLGL